MDETDGRSTDCRTDARTRQKHHDQHQKQQHNPIVDIICNGHFFTMFFAALASLDSQMTLDETKTAYGKLAVSACGTFFFLIMTVITADVA